MVGIDKMGGVLEDGRRRQGRGGLGKMSGALEDARRRQGRGGGGRSMGVELVCHDWAGEKRGGGGGERKERGKERGLVC